MTQEIPAALIEKWQTEANEKYPYLTLPPTDRYRQMEKRQAYLAACRKRWEEDNWISVEDAPPKEAGRYEVVREYDLGIGRDVCITNYIKHGKVWVTGNNWKVTHWKNIKPLPSLPKTAPATDTGDK